MSERFYKLLVITLSAYFVGWAFFGQAEINPSQKVAARYSQSQFLFESAIGDISGGIVPCGRSSGTAEQQRPCTTCDLFWLADNLINFVVLKLVPIIATLFILFAGFLMILGGPRPDLMKMGKNMMTYSLYGVAIIYSGWMITNFVLKSIAGSNDVSKNWYKIECAAGGAIEQPPIQPPVSQPPISQPPVSQPPVSQPPAGASVLQQLAQQLIDSGVAFSSSADCRPHNALENIQDIAAGNPPYVCSSTCTNNSGCTVGGASGNITVDSRILSGIETLKDSGFNFTVTSLTTGRHSATSDHYQGKGADISISSRDLSIWISARDKLKTLGGNPFCETRTGKSDPNCNLSGSDPTDHIHWSFK